MLISQTKSTAHSRTSHEFRDHTSEVTLLVRAHSYPALVAEATRAFVGLVPGARYREPSGEWREFRLTVPDRAGALVEWLNELVYLCEVEHWLPIDVEVEAENESDVRIRTRGADLAEPFVRVKAATLHNAAVREGPDGLEGEVTLDV